MSIPACLVHIKTMQTREFATQISYLGCPVIPVCTWQGPAALPAAVAFPASVAAPLVVLDASCLDVPARAEPNQALLQAQGPRAPRRPSRAARPCVKILDTAAERSAGPASTPLPRPAAASDVGDSPGLTSDGSAISGGRRCRELTTLGRRPRLGEHYRVLAGGCDGSASPGAGAGLDDCVPAHPAPGAGQRSTCMGRSEPRMPGVGPGASGSEAARPKCVAGSCPTSPRAAGLSSAAKASGLGRSMLACGAVSCEAGSPMAADQRLGECQFDDAAEDVRMQPAACTWASANPPAAADSDAALTRAPAAETPGPMRPVSAVEQSWAAEDGRSSSGGSVCSDLERMAVVAERDCSHGGLPGCSGSALAALDPADSSPRQQPLAGELAAARTPIAGAPGIAPGMLLCGSTHASPVSGGAQTPESSCASARQSLTLDGTGAVCEPDSTSTWAQQPPDSASSACTADVHALPADTHGGPQGAQGTRLGGGAGCMARASSLACAAGATRQHAAAGGVNPSACADLASPEGEAGRLTDPGADACALAAVVCGGDERAWGNLATAERETGGLADQAADACVLAAIPAGRQAGGRDGRAWAALSGALRGSGGSSGGGGAPAGSCRCSAAGAGCCGDMGAGGSGIRAESLPVQPGSPTWPPAPAAPAHGKPTNLVARESLRPGAHAEALHERTARASADMRGSTCERVPDPGAGEQENWAGIGGLAGSLGAARDRRAASLGSQRREWAALVELPVSRQPLRQSNPARFQTLNPAMPPPGVPACAAPAAASTCGASLPAADHALAGLQQSPAAAARSLPGSASELGSGAQSCLQRTLRSAADRSCAAEGMGSGICAALHESPVSPTPADCMDVEAGTGGAGRHADQPPCVGVCVSCNEPDAASEKARCCTAEPAERLACFGARVGQAGAPDTTGEAARCCMAEQAYRFACLGARVSHGGDPDSPGELRRCRMRLLAAARRRTGPCTGQALGGQGAAGRHAEQHRLPAPAASKYDACESYSGDLPSVAGASAAADAAPVLAAPNASTLSEGGLGEQTPRAAMAGGAGSRGCAADAGRLEPSSPAFLDTRPDLKAGAPAAGTILGGVPVAHIPSAPATAQAGLALADWSRSSAEAPSGVCGKAVLESGSRASQQAQPLRAAEGACSDACWRGLQGGAVEGAGSSAGLHATRDGCADMASRSSLCALHNATAGGACSGAGDLVFDPILGLYFDAASGQVYDEAAAKRMRENDSSEL